MFNKYYTHKYFPIIAGIGLMLFHYFSAYPGGMSPDTFDQFNQSLTGNFNSHHPPLMAMVWALFNYIYPGPQTMLFLHLTFLWGGVFLLFYADETNKFRKYYFFIPFIPMILSQSGTIWKDMSFGLSIFFIIATCIFYTYKQVKAPIYIVLGLLVICFYSVGVKFQAQFIIPVVIYFVISIYIKNNFKIKLFLSSVITAFIILFNLFIINNYSINTSSSQLRQFFDLAGISVRINNDTIIPEYIKKTPIYSFDKVKANYTAKWVDTLFYIPESKVFNATYDKFELEQLNSSFYSAIQVYPFTYFQHRGINFLYNMKANKFKDYAVVTEPALAAKFGFHQFKKNKLNTLIKKYLKIIPVFLNANVIAFILINIFAWYIYKNKYITSIEFTILKYIVLISIIYSITLFFTTMASDYRYYYLVRLLSLFSLPIYFKAKSSEKTS